MARPPRQRAERVAKDAIRVAEVTVKKLRQMLDRKRAEGEHWSPDKEFRETWDVAMTAVKNLPHVLSQVRSEIQAFTSTLDTDSVEQYAANELAFRFTRRMSDDQVIALLRARYGGDLAVELDKLIRDGRAARTAEARSRIERGPEEDGDGEVYQ